MIYSLAARPSGYVLGVNALREATGSMLLRGWEASLDSSGVETRNNLYPTMILDAHVSLLASNNDVPVSLIYHSVDANFNRRQLRGAPSATPVFNFIPSWERLFANSVHSRMLLVIALLTRILGIYFIQRLHRKISLKGSGGLAIPPCAY